MRNHLLCASAGLLLACGDDQPASPSQNTDGTTSSAMASSASNSNPESVTATTNPTDTTETSTTSTTGCMSDLERTDAFSLLARLRDGGWRATAMPARLDAVGRAFHIVVEQSKIVGNVAA